MILIILLFFNLSHATDQNLYKSSDNKGLSTEERMNSIESFLIKQSSRDTSKKHFDSLKSKLDDLQKSIQDINNLKIKETITEVDNIKNANWTKVFDSVEKIQKNDIKEIKQSISKINEDSISKIKNEIQLLKFRAKTLEGMVQTLETLSNQ
jgi:anion-transporting  ArsA/GET3 family ATPase